MQRIYDTDLPSGKIRCKQLSDDPHVAFHQLNDLQSPCSGNSSFDDPRASAYFEKCLKSNREHDRVHETNKPSGSNATSPKFNSTVDTYNPSKDKTRPNIEAKYPTPISHRYRLYLDRLNNAPSSLLDTTHLEEYIQYCHKHDYVPFSDESYEGKILDNHTYDDVSGLWREHRLPEITAEQLYCVNLFLHLRKQYFQIIIDTIRMCHLFELQKIAPEVSPDLGVSCDEFFESITANESNAFLTFGAGIYHYFVPDYDFPPECDEDSGIHLDFDLPVVTSKVWVSRLELSNKGFRRLYTLLHHLATNAGLLLENSVFCRVHERGRTFVAKFTRLISHTLRYNATTTKENVSNPSGIE